MDNHADTVILRLNHACLESESEVDCFLNHLDNDTLYGLQLRMTPVEYAIHVILSRNQTAAVNDSESASSDTTVRADNRTQTETNDRPGLGNLWETTKQTPQQTTGTVNLGNEPEVLVDDDSLPQNAPTCVIAKHKEEDPEKLRPYLAFLPRQVILETLKRTTRLAKALISFPLV